MDSVGSVLSMIAAMDAYMRPLYIMMIMSSMSISRKDLYEIFRYLLMVSVPVLLVGVMQFMPFIADSINDMLLNYYTGRSEYLFLSLLSVGRSTSVFAQASTYGLFVVLIFSIFLSQTLSKQSNQKHYNVLVIFLVILIAGLVSVSKVFVAGSFVVLLYHSVINFKLDLVLKYAIYIVGISFLAFLSNYFISMLYSESVSNYHHTVVMSHIDPNIIWETYFQSRFGNDGDIEPKVVRTGALETIINNIIFGGGVTVSFMATDSMIIGLLLNGGVVGTTIFFLFLYLIYNRIQVSAKSEVVDFHSIWISHALKGMFFVCLLGMIAAYTFTQDRVGDVFWVLVGSFIYSRSNFYHQTVGVHKNTLYRGD